MKKNREINKAVLEKAILQVEKKGPLPGLVIMQTAVTELYNSGKLGEITDEITPSIVGLRIKAWNIPIKTVAGKKGGDGSHLHAGRAMRGPRVSRADKLKSNPEVQKGIKQLRAEINSIPEARRFLPIVDAMVKGSMSKAVKLKCIECSNYQTSEVRDCVILSCPLFPFRPYQKKVKVTA